MMRALWIIIGLNILAVAAIGTLAYGFGGGFTSGTFPPDTPVVMMRLVPVEATSTAPSRASSGATAGSKPEVPAEYRSVEPAVERWETGADGRLRFRE